ncbi:MAG: class I SAM-dependent methyltransferase [Actinobacteria bacterium]|nr:MAG: class I SAM-dependent methyltransferase [Actinomycetota bacterium]
MTTTIQQTPSTDEFAERIFGSVLGALESWSVFIGDKFGLYEALAAEGPMSRSELAARTGIHRRYADEWLEHQVTLGILVVDDPTLAQDERSYSIPEAQAEVLTDKDSLAYLAPFVRLVVAGGIQLPKLLDAYRNGSGVSWSDFGADMRTGQAEMNRPWFMKELGASWFPSVDWLHDLLESGARVADVGCGEGWSSIGMALSYPEVVVDGYDIDEPSMVAARQHAARAGVSDRVSFHHGDAADAGEPGKYDLVTVFEAIHDMPDPVSVLRSMHRMSGDSGRVVVMDEAVADHFGERNDDVERLMYGFSMFVCLPDGMSHEHSVGTGTVMRPSTLERYAREAGFSGIEVLPIENDLWRFYELVK